MSISQLARSIPDSSTLRLNEEARLMRERGVPVIHLGIGEPKNKTPIGAVLSSAAMLNLGDIKYTPTDGIPSLKQAIIRYTEENYDRLVGPENVIVSVGAKQSLYNILFTLINPQDEVIILSPYWLSYPQMVRMVNGVPVIVTPEDGTFHPRMQDIERAVTGYTKAIILNSPNNPSGLVYSEAFIADIVAFCEKRDIYMVMDDIYHKLVFDDLTVPVAYNYSKQDLENSKIIVVNGVSKLYGMTGFRIGWAIAPRRLVEVMTNVQSQTTSGPSVVTQAAAEGALLGIQSVVEGLRLSIQNNRDVIMQELAGFNGVHVYRPQATFYAMVDFRAYTSNSVELSDFILKKAMVVTVPGVEFGAEGYLRLSFAGSIKDITEGVARMKWAVDPASPNEIYIGDRRMLRDWL